MKITRRELLTGTAASVLGLAKVEGRGTEQGGNEDFAVKPYLQLGRVPSASSMRVTWQTPDVAADWGVEFSLSRSGPWKKADTPAVRRLAVQGMKPRRMFNAAVTGLDAGKAFHYRIVKNGRPIFASDGIAAKAADQSFRLVVFGDMGCGTPEQKNIARQAHMAKPDLVVMPGDIVYENGRVSEYDSNFWPVYNADETGNQGVPMMRSVPFMAAPGNHDTDVRDLDRFPDGLAYFYFWDNPLNGVAAPEGSPIIPALVASETNRKAFMEVAGDAYPRMANFSFDYANTHWTIIDSCPYVDLTNKELQSWIARDLAAAQSATWRFVVFHHAGLNSANEHMDQQQTRLLSPILEGGKVDMVFNGHLHNYQRTFPMKFAPIKNGTLLVGGRDNKAVRGRVVPGQWKLDKSFDGVQNTVPKGIIYMITGAGGKELYNVEQNDDPDSWQKFTHKFVSRIHSLTVADISGTKLSIRQVAADGTEIDRFTVTKQA
jgi:hypothetical protein